MDERKHEQLVAEHLRQRQSLLRDLAKLEEYKLKMSLQQRQHQKLPLAERTLNKQVLVQDRRASLYNTHQVACEDLHEIVSETIQPKQSKHRKSATVPQISGHHLSAIDHKINSQLNSIPSWSKSKLPQLKPLSKRVTQSFNKESVIKGNRVTALPEIRGVKAKYSKHCVSLNDIPAYLRAPHNSSLSNHNKKQTATLPAVYEQRVYERDYLDKGEILWMNEYDRIRLHAYSKVTDWLQHNPITITRRV